MEHHHSFLTEWFAGAHGPDSPVSQCPDGVIMATVVALLLVGVSLIGTRKMSVDAPGGLQQFLELAVGGFFNFAKTIIPHGSAKHVPVMFGFAGFIFLANFLGLIPQLSSASAYFGVTLALALVSFLYYNMVSFKENGIIGHLKHLWGPVALIGPLFFMIELISHSARILSLSLRLFGNISGEHAASGVFYDLVPFLLPLPMMVLGLFGSFLQTFIFVLLSMVYLALMQDH